MSEFGSDPNLGSLFWWVDCRTSDRSVLDMTRGDVTPSGDFTSEVELADFTSS